MPVVVKGSCRCEIRRDAVEMARGCYGPRPLPRTPAGDGYEIVAMAIDPSRCPGKSSPISFTKLTPAPIPQTAGQPSKRYYNTCRATQRQG